jgi:hypothetical protein
MFIWHFLVHIGGVDYGLPYGKWGWYNFWSGIAGSFLVAAVVWGATKYWYGTCHHSLFCLRRGQFAAAGGVFKTCAVHHPDIDHTKPRHEEIARLHAEWKHMMGKAA